MDLVIVIAAPFEAACPVAIAFVIVVR